MHNWMTRLTLGVLAVIVLGTRVTLAADYPTEVANPITVVDPAVCQKLHDATREPASLPLDQYEDIYSRYFADFCHRDMQTG